MDLMDKLHDASEQDSGISLSADDVRELLSMLAESAGEVERLALTLDHVAEVFAPGRRSTVRN